MKGIKKGDRVRDISVTRRFGTITSVNHYGDPDCLVVRFDDDEESVCYVKDLDIYPGPKTAFLTELQSLLRKYDVQIHDGEYYYIGFEIGANRGDSQTIHYSIGDLDEMCITPDNIFDYDKD